MGSGGIMLPNHSPLVIAEAFGTLETLYPERIDLGLGRAPGSDQLTSRALRGPGAPQPRDFPELIEELEYYFAPAEPGQKLKAIPGADLNIPIWILGSSLFSAHLAARLGRPYSFASHFAPQLLHQALEIYRSEFQPSKYLQKPYVMVAAPVIAAETDERAEFLATSKYQTFLSLVRGKLKPMPPPIAPTEMAKLWNPGEEQMVHSMMKAAIVGGPKRLHHGLTDFIRATDADELIIASEVHSHAERLESYKIIAQTARL